MDESNKRQRTTSSSNNELHIKDLPDGLLVGISSYLAKPSVALFAIAMNTNNSQLTQTSKAMISNYCWDTLDFSDIEKTLAAKLSDSDVDNILRSIDAVSNLYILKLAGCVNITGVGLNMFRTTDNALQQIDLSLVGKHESPLIEPEPSLSEDSVLPILDDIISNGSSLRQLELPKKWRNTRSTQLDQFLVRYGNYLVASQRRSCSKCDELCGEEGEDWICRHRSTNYYGSQNYTCFGCLKHYCYREDCVDEEGEDGNRFITWCKKCEKVYCKSCAVMTRCDTCTDVYSCNECCVTKKCEGADCGNVLCDSCSEKRKCHICSSVKCSGCARRYRCELDGCIKVICAFCVDGDGEGGECDACRKVFCSTECRYLDCSKDETNTCINCLKVSASAYRRKLQECKKENEELCQGMDDLYKKYMNAEEEK